MQLVTNNISSSIPTHNLISPTDNKNILNFINFSDMGINTSNATKAFKKVQDSTKTNAYGLVSTNSDFSLKYNKINNLYLSDLRPMDSLYYGVNKQHEYSHLLNSSINNTNLIDSTSVTKYLNYVNNNHCSPINKLNPNLEYNLGNVSKDSGLGPVNNAFNSKVTQPLSNGGLVSAPQNLTNTSLETSTTQRNLGLEVLYNDFFIKSPNHETLSSERNLRNTDWVNPTKHNYNFNQGSISGLVDQLGIRFENTYTPSSFFKNNSLSRSFDQYLTNGLAPTLLNSNADISPTFIFSPY